MELLTNKIWEGAREEYITYWNALEINKSDLNEFTMMFNIQTNNYGRIAVIYSLLTCLCNGKIKSNFTPENFIDSKTEKIMSNLMLFVNGFVSKYSKYYASHIIWIHDFLIETKFHRHVFDVKKNIGEIWIKKMDKIKLNYIFLRSWCKNVLDGEYYDYLEDHF